ncbi:L-ribulose-5-phosphate 3-epimerase [Parablautia intestinalis]|uniref:L-ribulose-5-phosphate 3-epimerase n=1 Tax=Parablautia intestinalis TaxID=2320100 RepID=UPI00256EDBAF|nr:L-ribulose-5-phosphate 3-epimerase [Parablautia intestinalis]
MERKSVMREYELGLYEKAMPAQLSWKEKLRAAGAAGYDYVEISIDETEEKIRRIYMSREERLSMIYDMYETGTPIRSMCVSALTRYSLGNSDSELRSRGLEIARGAIQLAEDLGVRIVMIPGYDIYYGESTVQTKQFFEENLEKVVLFAASLGVLVEMETMENAFMNTVWKAMYHVRKIRSAYLGVYPDSGNITNAAVSYGSDEVQDILSGRGHISSLHLKESCPGKFREIPYGEGHVDFEKVIRAAWSIGVRKYVTEFWYQGNRTWEKDLSSVNERMRRILDGQIGV